MSCDICLCLSSLRSNIYIFKQHSPFFIYLMREAGVGQVMVRLGEDEAWAAHVPVERGPCNPEDRLL